VFGIFHTLKKNKLKMKKILLILVAMLGLTATAQTGFKKSDVFVEGTFSYAKEKEQDATYSVAPTVGYFLTDKFAVGAQVEKTNTTDKLGAGVFARCYFLNVGKDFKVFSGLNLNTNALVLDTTTEDFITKQNFNAGLNLGVNYFVTKNLALSANLANLAGYNFETESFNVGFDGVDNPFTASKFGVLYKF
jgi:outer membrane protein